VAAHLAPDAVPPVAPASELPVTSTDLRGVRTSIPSGASMQEREAYRTGGEQAQPDSDTLPPADIPFGLTTGLGLRQGPLGPTTLASQEARSGTVYSPTLEIFPRSPRC
jgi:hypothetical protein